MTLSTYLYVHDPIDPKDFFDGVRWLVGELTPDHPGFAHQVIEETDTWQTGVRKWHTIPGQGLAAWVTVRYVPDGWLYPEGEPCDKWCGEPCELGHAPKSYLLLDMDTTYGYRSELGGCGHLHAYIIERVGTILDEMGIGYYWVNEYTGVGYTGSQGTDSLRNPRAHS